MKNILNIFFNEKYNIYIYIDEKSSFDKKIKHNIYCLK